MHPRDFPSTFRVGAGASIIFCQLSVRPRYFPSTFHSVEGRSVNFLCIRGIFRQLSVHPQDLPSTYCASSGNTIKSVNLSCVRETILNLSALLLDFPSTSVSFLCVRGTFRQYFMHLWNLPSTFHMSAGYSVQFHQLLSTLRASTRPSINFPCVHETFHQLSVRLRDFP